MKNYLLFIVLALFIVFSASGTFAQNARILSGMVVTPQFELVPGATIEVQSSAGKISAVTDGEGAFSLRIPEGEITVVFGGKNIQPVARNFGAGESTKD